MLLCGGERDRARGSSLSLSLPLPSIHPSIHPSLAVAPTDTYIPYLPLLPRRWSIRLRMVGRSVCASVCASVCECGKKEEEGGGEAGNRHRCGSLFFCLLLSFFPSFAFPWLVASHPKEREREIEREKLLLLPSFFFPSTTVYLKRFPCKIVHSSVVYVVSVSVSLWACVATFGLSI